jgi:hypothetical protein
MNAAQDSADFITRVMNLKEFEVKRLLDEPLAFRGGVVPFDIRASQDCAWFKVLALTQKEAEDKVDHWLTSQKDGWND